MKQVIRSQGFRTSIANILSNTFVDHHEPIMVQSIASLGSVDNNREYTLHIQVVPKRKYWLFGELYYKWFVEIAYQTSRDHRTTIFNRKGTSDTNILRNHNPVRRNSCLL